MFSLERERTQMGDILRPDLCVIGAGSGGLSVAAIAASFGVSVVLVEKGEMGGDCLNVGCVPSKALIAAAERAQAMREGAVFGLGAARPKADFAILREHIRGVIDAIAPNDSVARFTAMGVQVVRAPARFIDRLTIVAGEATIQPRRFVIATGSRPAAPDIPGLADVAYLTNESIFDLGEQPERLVVIGGGPIGLEIAQAYRRLGCKVIVLEAHRILPREDRELAQEIERQLLADGVELRQGVKIARVVQEKAGEREARFVVTLQEDMQGENGASETVDGSHLLVATGRTPTIGDLGLDLAGVKTNPSGIVVDRGLRTSNRRIYAIGDCASGGTHGYRFTHAANHHAGLVVRSALFRLPVKLDNSAIPRVTYTDPELAVVGLSEEEARLRHKQIRILRWPVAENDRAQAERRVAGHIKAIVARNGLILGCAIAAPGAGELISLWTLAISKGMKAQDLAGIVIPYPTYSEISKRAAVEHLRPAARSAWVRRILAFLRRLG
jgi:pyruvate/2-oxoglutarate dehydrogenase complex dihydrolipoamide dehydrogenase (E3) component